MIINDIVLEEKIFERLKSRHQRTLVLDFNEEYKAGTFLNITLGYWELSPNRTRELKPWPSIGLLAKINMAQRVESKIVLEVVVVYSDQP